MAPRFHKRSSKARPKRVLALTKKGSAGKKAKTKAPVAKHTRPVDPEYLEHLNALVIRGRGRGFVTDAEVLNYFPDIEKNLPFLEQVYDRLEKEGIKVQESSPLVKHVREDRAEVTAEELKAATRIEADLPDAVQMYLREIGRTPLLTQKEEKELAKRIERGDELARQKLIQANLRLVVSIAKRYVNRSPISPSLTSFKRGISAFRKPSTSLTTIKDLNFPPMLPGGYGRR